MEAQTSSPDMPHLSSRSTILAAAAAIFGWGLDLFDLFILLYVAPVIGDLFFPSSKPMLSLAAVYASFAVTLFVRPVGSAVFGSYADRYGRRKAMIVAVVGVGLSTAVFGLLPTVAQVGTIASFIFLAFRLVQGVFVGGVIASSHTIGTESVPERWRGMISGAIGGGGSAIGGVLASSVFFVVTEIAPGPAYTSWGWRLMFFSGLLTSAVGLLLFRNLEESPFFQAMQKRKAARKQSAEIVRSPLATLFTAENRGNFLLNCLLTLGAGGGYYLTIGYMPSFLAKVSKVPNHDASLILASVSISSIVAALISGHLSQFIGRKPVMVAIGAVRLVAYPVLFIAMAHAGSLFVLAMYAVLLAFVTNASYAPLQVCLNERYPTQLRASGTGLTWNIGFAIGGTLPALVPLYANTANDLPMVLAVFSVVVSAIFFVATLIVPETRGNLDRS